MSCRWSRACVRVGSWRRNLYSPPLGIFSQRRKAATSTRQHDDSGVTEGEGLRGDTLRIGCSSGFWGDSAAAAPQLVHHGNIDFLVADYLSEITMSLLTAAKQKSPDLGYTPDFVQSLKPLLKEIKRNGIRVVANAGGVNPHSCVAALNKVAAEEGVELSVAMVTGDNLMDKLEEIKTLGVEDLDTGRPLPLLVHSMNAYLGAFPIAEALDLGADVVVTGRCVDSALTLGPLIHKVLSFLDPQFGWKRADLNCLAAGSLAGHLVECGAQVTGGIFTDWDKVNGWENMGFPVVECDREGKIVVSKPENTGGLVSWGTVTEQLVYEIGDPANYLLPDVTCDFSNVKISELKADNGGGVLVTGARGKPPSKDYKVNATYADGYRAVAVCPVIGPRAAEKAQKTADAILNRTRVMFKHLGLPDYSQTHVHMIGSESSYGSSPSSSSSPREVTLWMGARHQRKEALQIFAREIAPAGTGMAPGLTALVGGRPKVSPVLRTFSFLYPKERLPIYVYLNSELAKTLTYTTPETSTSTPPSPLHTPDAGSRGTKTGSHDYRLEQLAFLRSGDKGDTANIGVVARHSSLVPYLREALTAEAVREYFSHLLEEGSSVEKFELPGIGGLNFVLSHSLGGGGVASLRIDPQGKAYAQMLADFKVCGMPSLEELASDHALSSYAELS